MSEQGGLDRYTGHRTTEQAELGHVHCRVGSLEVLYDRLGHVAVDRVDEHRTRHCGRVVRVVLRLVHLRIRHRPDPIDDGCGEGPERRDDALSGLDCPGVDQHGHHDEPSPHSSAGW